MKDFEPRNDVVGYLRKVLYGPQGGPTEEISGTPFLRYMTGMLFPLQQAVQAGEKSVTATADEEQAGAERGGEEGEMEIGLQLAFEMLQAAVGISFRVQDSAKVRCKAWAARYEKVAKDNKTGTGDGATAVKKTSRSGQNWQRVPIGSETMPEEVTIERATAPLDILADRAQLLTRWRSLGDGTAIVTISLVNNQRSGKAGLDPSLALFQVGLRCEVDGHGILPYPEVGTEHKPGSEEAEVAFLYKDCQPFARGHGAAATWGGIDGATCRWVAVDFIPEADVPAPTFELSSTEVDPRCTKLEFLCKAPRQEVIAVLRSLYAGYATWVKRQGEAKVPPEFAETAAEFLRRADDWLVRMDKGIALLAGVDDTVWQAFRLANRAMAMQMVLSKARKSGPYTAAEKRRSPEFNFEKLSWRPFQVAFMLATIESTWNEYSTDREIVDVIWFPTGGGKTEAYLFVTALELVRRRLVYGASDTATAVMSRYTLRMLTAQQFQRTAALVVALEMIRREDLGLLGERPFSLGLWVGPLTDNKARDAHERYMDLLKSARPENPFQLQACPCCATEIFPARPSGKPGHWNLAEFGVHSTQDSFRFYCPSVACEFHDGIPLQVIDDELYDTPPSMLIGTLDKFAQLPWDSRSRTFFGGRDDASPPPSLIIQDELHLISGPLGSISAPYEVAIETVIRLRGGRPKRIASTATIRNAREQVKALYGGRSAAVFPSPCGSWEDAFFFSTDKGKPDRKYVGLMGQGYTKPVVAMTWAAAAILQATNEVKLDPEVLDAYWTLLVYHNSRRELGRTLTAARDEIDTRIKVIASETVLPREMGEPLELSAQMVKSMSEAIEALERKHSASRAAVDLVPCTNIISVGVDIDRLGVMMVNGQPKLTSEYIQATSRVGRGEIPGLVIALFSPSKPRDRSHYEDFRAYHEAIYRHVEPTSVTPYALPSRTRTLHAALVALVRHGLAWSKTDEAGKVNFEDPSTRAAIEQMLQLMCAADPDEASELRELAEQRLQEWQEFAETHINVLYQNRQVGMSFPALLYQYGHPPNRAQWPTMNSVRNVDFETLISVQ
jgi:hypothetical protein